MSEHESRILPWPGPPGPPVPPRPPWGGPNPGWGWPRPPTGAWPPGPVVPPGPGPFPQPPDVFSAFAWLAKNYQESQAAKAFLAMLIKDLIAEDPSFLANAQATVGVTDGSAAQPGMVGEVVRFEQPVSVAVGNTTQNVTFGVLPPGDWDISATAYATAGAGMAAALFSVDIELNPVPAGFSDKLLIAGGFPTPVDNVLITSSREVARTVSPSLINFSVATGVSTAGSIWLIFSARRAR